MNATTMGPTLKSDPGGLTKSMVSFEGKPPLPEVHWPDQGPLAIGEQF